MMNNNIISHRSRGRGRETRAERARSSTELRMGHPRIGWGRKPYFPEGARSVQGGLVEL